MEFLGRETYQAKVNELFLTIKKDITHLLSNCRFEHIGGSSIKGAVSKGDLDIFVGVNQEQFESIIMDLKNVGFTEKQGTLRTNQLCMLVTDKYNHDVALQVVVNGSEFENFLKFRDLMNSRPELVSEMNMFKRQCHGFSPEKYREVKSKWVENIINQYLG